jgi:hypothetical protein
MMPASACGVWRSTEAPKPKGTSVQQLPFRQAGKFYRGNLHTHSTNSDGDFSPEDVVAHYRRHGYDFVAITDHLLSEYGFPVTDTTGFRDESFTTLLGAELHGPSLQNGEPWHIVAVGLPGDFPQPALDQPAAALAARAAEAGAFIGLAHPAWYGLLPEDGRTIEVAHAVEVYNETCVLLSDRGDSWPYLDMLLNEGWRLNAYGADDAHLRVNHPDAFGAWVMVRAERLDPDALLDALKAGHYYTSQGPLIHDIAVEGDELEIACSPASSIYAAGYGSRSERRHGNGLTGCRLPLERFSSSYCRVTIVDRFGRRAWSNPIWLA